MMENLHSTKNQPQRIVKHQFDVTKEVGQGSERHPRSIRDRLTT